ncbi:MAG: Gfo/Idh/MocA family oxidoreductase, partial [Pseudomonadota bacterium]
MLRVATIGAGYFSQFHLEAWSRMADVELVAVCDSDLARAKEAANHLKTVSTFDDAQAMIDAVKPDLIDIITPPRTHETLLMLCAEAGVDAVCQKPFATDLTTAKRLTILTESAGIRVNIHENF